MQAMCVATRSNVEKRWFFTGLQWIGHWNDYFTGLIYVNEQDKLPLQNVLQQILLANQTNQMGQDSALSGVEAQQFADQIKYGVIIVATLPLLVIYPFLQKYFEKGVMVGAVKGW